MSNDKFSFYKEHPKTCEADDFWGQVKRTVNGKPVSQDQIDMIVTAVVKGLALNDQDTLLDLCCGNGALSTLLFDHCRGGIGIDFSKHLIEIANKNFAKIGSRMFYLDDVVDACSSISEPERFTKAVCYGSFPYLEAGRAELLLSTLNIRYPKLSRVFIGNCPDKKLAADFFGDREYSENLLSDPSSAIGVWRTFDEFIALAATCGWQAEVRKMPSNYYAAHYRYDIILIK